MNTTSGLGIESGDPEERAIFDRLSKEVADASARYAITGVAESALLQLAAEGARSLASAGASKKEIKRARANLRKVMGRARGEAAARTDTNRRDAVVTDEDVTAAFRWLCPGLWPFC